MLCQFFIPIPFFMYTIFPTYKVVSIAPAERSTANDQRPTVLYQDVSILFNNSKIISAFLFISSLSILTIEKIGNQPSFIKI